ncbi:hypothetical protein V6N13_142896 [Hibiscus sabdariffa]
MVILLFHFFLLFTAAAADYPPGCRPKSCKRHGPSVRYPFQLKGQSDGCGSPGFNLSCDNKNRTVLELPRSVKLLVKRIDYVNQMMQAYAEDGCVQNQLPNLTLSASPFRTNSYDSSSSLGNYSLFVCSDEGRSDYDGYYNSISCLRTERGSYVKYTSSDYSSTDLLHCRKMIDLIQVPEVIVSDKINNVYFYRSTPACGSCEAQHRGCGPINNHTNAVGVQCFEIPVKHMGANVKRMISGSTIGGFFLVMSLSVLLWMHYLRKKEKDAQRKIEQFLEDYKALKPSRYSYADIKRITFQFKEKLGQGGYGTVFKGTLSNDVSVAVKVLNNFKGNGEEFINEVGSMGRIHHVNITRLVGFCADGYNRALVYEYLPNESLEKFIFGDKGEDRPFGWEKLHEIALGIAKGIEYLHQGCEQRILHFDIKPHNILLDENFNLKISDFGLAKLCSKEQSAVSMTAARGTMGYIAPEVLSRYFGNVSYKSDVYSFGMLLLEMVGGRRNIDVKVENISQVYFPEWVYNRLDKGEELGISQVYFPEWVYNPPCQHHSARWILCRWI